MRRRGSARALVQEELEVLPLMNLFVVLIPMLLLSAVFLEMSVIRMTFPHDSAQAAPKSESLGLSVTIQESTWTVRGRGIADVVIDRDTPEAGADLRSTLAGLSQRHPEERAVIVRSEEHTRYEDIVAVMDASRESGFPSVSLAGAGS